MADRDYRVALDIYSGPLDLLLYLIRETEVEIYDIPIARITAQYLLYVEALKIIDLNLAGDFLVMASRLMEIKAKMLAPEVTLEDEVEEEDPRLELVRQLIEYKKFKEAARDLEGLVRERALRFGRPAEKHDEAGEETKEETDLLGEASVWALLNAFARLIRETGGPLETTIIYDDLPIDAYMARIMAIVMERRVVAFFDLFTDRKNRIVIIGTFLAILELVRLRKIRAQQAAPFGEIQIILREDAPADEPPPGQPITQGLVGDAPPQSEGPLPDQPEEPLSAEKLPDESMAQVQIPPQGEPAEDSSAAQPTPDVRPVEEPAVQELPQGKSPLDESGEQLADEPTEEEHPHDGPPQEQAEQATSEPPPPPQAAPQPPPAGETEGAEEPSGTPAPPDAQPTAQETAHPAPEEKPPAEPDEGAEPDREPETQ